MMTWWSLGKPRLWFLKHIKSLLKLQLVIWPCLFLCSAEKITRLCYQVFIAGTIFILIWKCGFLLWPFIFEWYFSFTGLCENVKQEPVKLAVNQLFCFWIGSDIDRDTFCWWVISLWTSKAIFLEQLQNTITRPPWSDVDKLLSRVVPQWWSVDEYGVF